MMDGKAFGLEMTEIVKGYVDRATGPLLARIETLEKRQPEKGDRGDPGESIKGETGVGLAGALIDRSGVLVLTLSDGTTRDLGVVVGKDGQDGTDGADGLPGEPGKDAEAHEETAPVITDEEKATLAAALLRKELGDEVLIRLPEPLPVAHSQPPQSPVHLVIENHMPKRGVEKTTVTKHDERGRIVEFERREG